MTAWNDSTISQQFGEIPYKPPCLPQEIKKQKIYKKQKKNQKGKVRKPQRNVQMCGSYRGHKPKYSGN